MAGASGKPPIDHAFRSATLKGGAEDPTYAGALSFMRRRYSRDLTGVDLAILGVPLDVTVTNRPGARFGPQAIRRASAILDGDPQYPFGIDIFADIAAVDYGDVALDLHNPLTIPETIEAEAREILDADVHLLSLGGDHFVTWPLLKAHAEKYGPAGAGPVRRASGHLARRRAEALARHVRRPGRPPGDRQPGPLHPDRHPHAGAGGLRHRPSSPRTTCIGCRRTASRRASATKSAACRRISPSTSTASIRPSRRGPERRSRGAFPRRRR